MSVDAEIVVLFREPQSQATYSLDPFPVELSMIDDADCRCWVSPAGEFEYLDEPRSGPLLGERSLEGRLYVGRLGRLWPPKDRDYAGEPARARYVGTLTELLARVDVELVWYGRLTSDTGCSGVPASTHAWIKSFFALAFHA